VPAEVLESLGWSATTSGVSPGEWTVLERWTARCRIRRGEAGGRRVVFGEPGDLTLLVPPSGSSISCRPVTKQLVDAGRHPRRYCTV